jgi:hypothetical protein
MEPLRGGAYYELIRLLGALPWERINDGLSELVLMCIGCYTVKPPHVFGPFCSSDMGDSQGGSS